MHEALMLAVPLCRHTLIYAGALARSWLARLNERSAGAAFSAERAC